MTIKGHNLYVDGLKVNSGLIPVGQPYTIDGLPSGSDFILTATNVDYAGNESEFSLAVPVSTLPYSWTPEDPVSDEDKLTIDNIVAGHLAEIGNYGVIVAVTGPKGRYSKAYGVKNRSNNAPMTLDEHWRMASVTKTFISHAVLMLIERNELSFDDKLGDFLNNMPNGDSITIRHMLMHTSGLPEYLKNTAIALWMTLTPTLGLGDLTLLNAVRIMGAQFAPGARFQYTNTNYVMLDFIIEAVAGMETRMFLQDEIFTPLGLTETSWPTTASLPAPYSEGYSGTRRITSFHPSWARGAGAVVTTMADMVKWTEAMRDGVLLSPEMHHEWQNTFTVLPNAGEGPDLQGYGYGVVSFGEWLGHNGAIPGFECQTMFNPSNGATISVMQNKQGNPTTIGKLWYKLANYLYPSSLATRDYFSVDAAPSSAKLSITTGTPDIVLDEPAKIVAPKGIDLELTTGIPVINGAEVIETFGAVLTITMGTPDVSIVEHPFEPFTETNLNRFDRPVPHGAAGCYVTLIGGGGGGGGGERVSTAPAYGGGGGGGGAKIKRIFIPASALGSTYSVTRGLGGSGGGSGSHGQDGTDSVFTSGPVTLSAGGGKRGLRYVSDPDGTQPYGGSGGTCSVSGISIDPSYLLNGGNGADGGTDSGQAAADVNTGAAAGGGAGGGGPATISGTRAGGNGGASVQSSGGIGATASIPAESPSTVPDGGGGGGGGRGYNGESTNNLNGGNGGEAGGGGGGGGGRVYTSGSAGAGGKGGDGRTVIEWVAEAPS